ncbi:MAG: beta-ketoacyl-ACP synthase II [Candidatus Cloacimonetes bacterium]|nr:beta-ketoacyl-ACP synthase II [Candidatus Cloacimonadota bacterium]
MERVVITGLGVVSALGNDVDTCFQSLLSKKSGVSEITSFDCSSHLTKIAAEVKDLPVEDYFDVKSLKKHDRFSQFAIIAADQAIKQSGFLDSDVDLERCGVFVGSGIGGLLSHESTQKNFEKRGVRGVSPFYISNLISNLGGGNIAIRYGLKGQNFGLVSACSTGTHSIGEAFLKIKYGDQDVIVAGGAEASITPVTMAGFANMKAMSRRNDSPTEASRPYDKDRDGFVMGEGAGILVLESYTNATKRGATILGEVVGYGATCDAYHITAVAPGGEGVVRSTKLALNQAKISPDEISYINTHGTSTPLGDQYEVEFIKKVFTNTYKSLPVSSSKSMIGHLLGAAGGVESVICVQSMVENMVHPTLNLENPGEGFDLDFVVNEARETKLNYVLKNSMGFGGHNASLIFKNFEE